MAGFQFEQLPMSPEQDMEREVQRGRQDIQDKYTLQWQTVNRNAKTMGRQKHQAMLQQIDANAKQEMLQFNQQAKQQMDRFKTVDRIADAGGMEPDRQAELKADMAYGRDVAGAMYPTEAKERSVPQQFGELDAHTNRLTARLKHFRTVGPKPPRTPKATDFIFPLAGAISAYRSISELKKRKKQGPSPLEVYDYSIPVEDKKKDGTTEITMGAWRKATPEEVQERDVLSKELKQVRSQKTKLLGSADVSNRVKQPGEQGGTFGDKVAESYKGPKTSNDDPLGLFN